MISSQTAHHIFTAKSALAQPGTRRAFRRMLSEEFWNAEAHRERQLTRAMAVARRAFTATSYYRELYSAAGFRFEDLMDAANFVHLPPVTKEAVREHGQAMIDPTARRRGLPSTTGGSTGHPVRVMHDRASPVAAMWWRAHRWWGVGAGEHAAFITRQHRAGWRAKVEGAQWWPTRHVHLNAHAMSPEAIAAFALQWNRVQPQVLTGYVEAIHELARAASAQSLDLIPPRAVAVTASVLRDTQRSLIEAALRAPVYDCYRSAEIPWIAAQCREKKALHIMADLRVVETVNSKSKPASTGELGDVLLTDLTNSVQFLVRYRIGDRAMLLQERCACGMGLPTMSPVDGREIDVLRSPDGRVVPGGLSTVFSRWPDRVDHFQILQHADYSVTLRCVPTRSFAHAQPAAEAVARDIAHMLGDQIPVRFEFVAAIDHDGGKAKLVVSAAPEAS